MAAPPMQGPALPPGFVAPVPWQGPLLPPGFAPQPNAVARLNFRDSNNLDTMFYLSMLNNDTPLFDNTSDLYKDLERYINGKSSTHTNPQYGAGLQGLNQNQSIKKPEKSNIKTYNIGEGVIGDIKMNYKRPIAYRYSKPLTASGINEPNRDTHDLL